MGRPRKNRVGEYAGLLADELTSQLRQEILKSIADSQKVYQDQINRLKSEIRKLSKQVESLRKARTAKQQRVGKWVPGGPGRPPKDAAERIAAFKNRRSKE